MKRHDNAPIPVVRRATEEDIENVCRWCEQRGMDVPPRDMFSSLGFVVPGVAYWGLYLTDSSIAHVGMLIGNPAVSKAERNAGLDAVVERTLQEARDAGTRLIVVPVELDIVEARLVRHGFTVLGRRYTYLGANLGDPAGR